MKMNMNELPDYLNDKDMAEFKDLFDDIERNAEISDEQQQRILSSVMRKAGNDMDTVLKNKRNINETIPERTIETSRKIQIKRGGAIAACIALIAAGGVMFSLKNKVRNVVPNTERDSSVTNDADLSEVKETDNSQTENKPVSETRNVQAWAKPYLEQNADTVGYLKLKDLTESGDYETPVVQGDDNEFYLHHGFDKEDIETGTVFADCNVPIDENGQPSNIVLYGYYTDESDKMSSSPILKYKDSKFFEKHQTIDFCTIFDDPDTKYQLISCFNYDVQDEDFTDYYVRARNFGDEYSFDKLLSNVKESAINKSDIECTEKDDYITLVTKDYENGEEGRFAVVAKKVTEAADEETSQKEESSKDKTKVENPKNSTKEAINNKPNPDVSKDNNAEDKSENISSQKTKNDGVIARMYERYSKIAAGYEQINDDRYLITIYDLENHVENKYIIYDASSDFEVTTITTDMVNPRVFAGKFSLYNYDDTENYVFPTLYAAVYDENGNVLHEYSVDTDNGKGYRTEIISPVFNNDGSRMFYATEKNGIEDSINTEIYYVDSGENTPHLLNKDSLKDKTVRNWAATNDAIITECVDEVVLISAEPDCKENVAVSDFTLTDYDGWGYCGSLSNGYFCVYSNPGEITIIAPDDNGDTQVGSKHYTIKTYKLGNDDYNTNFAMSNSGRYLVASYIDLLANVGDYTLYELGKDSVTEIKTVNTKIYDTEYNMLHFGGYFDESTGIFTFCREKQTASEDGDSTITFDYKFDIINFFE
jgi:SrtB family sortase